MGFLNAEYVEKYRVQPDILGDKPRLKLDKSIAEFEKAQKLMPGGVYGMRGPHFFIYGEYPIYIDRGEGCHMWDIDGNEFIDFIASYGPTTIGFTEPEIYEPTFEKIRGGFSFSIAQTVQNELAAKLQQIIPCCERTVFARTGTDSVTIAVKMARAYTLKNKILMDSTYHGWSDLSQVYYDAGVPQQARDLAISHNWGDLAAFEETLENDKDIACILVCPIHHQLAKPMNHDKSFIEGLRKLATKHGVVLIFDEVRSGFRMALGGAQEYLGITPDVACFSKAIANGFPLAAVCGKKEILETITYEPKEGSHGTYMSSTFFLNSAEMVAALKTIEFYEKNDVIGNIFEKGRYFNKRIDEIIAKHNAPVINGGNEVMPGWIFDQEKLGEEMFIAMTFKLFTYLIRSGIFMHPIHKSYITYRQTKEDLDKALEAFDKGLAVVKEAYPW